MKTSARISAGSWRLRLPHFAVPVAALILACFAAFAITSLVASANADRQAQLTLETVKTQLNTIQGEPYASGQLAAVPVIKAAIRGTEGEIERELAGLHGTTPDRALRTIAVSLHKNFAMLERLRELVAEGRPQDAYALDPRARAALAAVSRELQVVSSAYRQQARSALRATTFGSIGVIGVLLAAFMFFYVSASRSKAALARLLARRQSEAASDPLTGLGNRRALEDAFGSTDVSVSESLPLAVILLDLDGFKAYNDTFGHLAGDAMLARLGQRLASTVAGIGAAFRVGGDEFCVLVRSEAQEVESVARFAAAALSDEGEGFRIGCSYGIALVPADGRNPADALGVADQRMYEQKRHRGGVGRRDAA